MWLLNPYRFGYTPTDANAAAYIAAVEAADGQPLESGVRQAIDQFVIGCKADGIWNAIKASCIMAGARTLNGALVPLVGAAPTNFNFVAGDYNRKTGLWPGATNTTKYLNSNRNNNADPQNNRHVACYRARAAVGNQAYIAARTGGVVTGGTYLWTLGAAPQFAIVPNVDAHNTGGSDTLNVPTFHGVTRSSSTATTGRINGTNYSFTRTSATPISNNLRVFAGANDVSQELFTTARIAFYSVGESLDLALLDARVTALINAFAAAIP